MTVHGDTLYSAWFSSGTIAVDDLATGRSQPSLTLQDYDGWILGMAVTDDGRLIVSGDSWGDTVRIYDATSGAKLRELHPETSVFALSCVTRR